MESIHDSSAEPKLIRAIGRWSVTAMVINGIIGSGVFALPAVIAKLLGPISPLAYVAAALLVLTIVLCFAEAAGRFTGTGGPYLYARESMGKLVGFEIGWISYLVRVTSVAANYAVFLEYLAYFSPEASRSPTRAIVLTLLVALQAATNILGVRQGTWLVNVFTLAKLIPLAALILAGLFHLNLGAFSGAAAPDYQHTTRAVLLLMFAFGGFEQTTFVAGEMRDPRRDLPWALVLALFVVTVIYVSVQVICTSILPNLATETRPLASAGAILFGASGAAIISAGALLSTFGHTSGSMLQSPRMTFALAEGGQLPSVFGVVLPGRRTPFVSILVFAGLVWSLTVWGSFVQLAALSALARVCTYITTAIAVIVFRKKRPSERGRLLVRAGAFVPFIAIACSIWLLSNATRKEIIAGSIALLVGAALYLIGRLQRGRTGEPGSRSIGEPGNRGTGEPGNRRTGEPGSR